MSIELFVDDIESVEEALRDDYVKGDDGRYVLKGMASALSGYVKVDDIEKHEKTQGLVSALDKERESRREAERKARELEERSSGMTEEEKKELETLRTARAEAEEKRRRAEGEFDKWREEIAQKHDQAIKDIVAERDQLREALVGGEVSRQIATALSDHGGRAAVLTPMLQQYVQATYEDGKVSISVTDADGNRKLDDQGNPLTISGFVEGMAKDKDFGDLFASKMKSGGGSGGDGGADGSQQQSQQGQQNQTDAEGRLKELESLANPNPRERLEMARLRGTAPTSEQLQQKYAGQVQNNPR